MVGESNMFSLGRVIDWKFRNEAGSRVMGFFGRSELWEGCYMLDFIDEYIIIYSLIPRFAESRSTMNKRYMFYSLNNYTVSKYGRWWNDETPRNFWYTEDKYFDDTREKASIMGVN